jgi:nicotinamidase-related amidase
MIKLAKAAAVMVDFQERLFPHMADHEWLHDRVSRLSAGLKLFEVPTLITQQYTKGLGPTLKTLEIEGALIEKMSFSAWREEGFSAALRKKHKKQIILAGIEAHICLLQTAMDLIDAGYKVYIPADATSSREKTNHANALQRLEKAGAVITNVESVLFELCRNANDERFKALSKIVK